MIQNINIPKGIKTVLVTGASSGIGKAFVSKFAQLGLNCVLVSNQEKELKEVSQYLEKEYDIKTWILYQDLRDPNSSQKVFNFCKKNNIEIDILVNNAGIIFFEKLSKLSEKEISSILNLHVHTLTLLTHLFGKEMIKRRKGFIINISSFTAWTTFPGLHLYNSTKRYIRDFSKSIYYEFRKYNVGVSVVCPSGVNTNFFPLSENLRKTAIKWNIIISPERVAEKSIRKTFEFKKEIFLRFSDRFFAFLLQHLPDWIIFGIMKKLPQFQDE